MNRKKFIKKVSTGILVGVPLLALSNCSDSDDGDGMTPSSESEVNCLDNGTAASVSANHGHSIIVSAADVDAAVEKTYSISGSATHNHMVTITAALFADLKSNQEITVGTTNDNGHTHAVTVTCA